MLEAAGVPFEAVEAELDEEAAKGGLRGAGFDPRGVAEELAAAEGALASRPATTTLVLGSDQTLERDDGTMLEQAGIARGSAATSCRPSAAGPITSIPPR